MLKEFSEAIKNIPSETKDIISEIKNNLQGKNSRVDEAKNQINDLKYKKQETTNENNKKKKESKKKRMV